ncbi:MAG: glycosyltransferase family 4 protein [Anditalea sp.]
MDQNKKVLIITYYWPPSAGSGVQRWLKFAKYLPGYGWDPIVFTPENPDFELQDESLLREVPVGMEVLRFPIWEPYSILRSLKKEKIKDPGVIMEKKNKSLLDQVAIWLRANAIVPDPKVYWVKPSVGFLLDIIEKNNIEAIITTGPPHSLHLIGRDIKRKKEIPWIADFRDPWSSWEFLDSLPMLKMIRKKHELMEQSVLREADAVMTISPTFKTEIEAIGNREVRVITNGFDRTDMPISFNAPINDAGAFHIVYTGIIDSIRDPIPFLNAFKSAFCKTEKEVLLTFVGKVSGQVVDFIKGDPWLSAQVEFAGYLSHQEVFKFYAKANLLLLILTHTKNAKGNIPGKLFEYIATGRKIIALGDPGGDAAKIIQEANAGKVFKHEAVKEIQQFLENQFNSSTKEVENKSIEQFERKFLTGNLAKLLDEKVHSIS